MTIAANQRQLTVIFRPQENKTYSGDVENASDVFLSDIDLAVSGEGFFDTYDVIAQGGETWDLLSYLFYNRQDKLLKIWQENKHLNDTDKRNFAVFGDTVFFKKNLTEEEKAEGANSEQNLLPPWKQ
jgi:hypothetical protein